MIFFETLVQIYFPKLFYAGHRRIFVIMPSEPGNDSKECWDNGREKKVFFFENRKDRPVPGRAVPDQVPAPPRV